MATWHVWVHCHKSWCDITCNSLLPHPMKHGFWGPNCTYVPCNAPQCNRGHDCWWCAWWLQILPLDRWKCHRLIFSSCYGDNTNPLVRQHYELHTSDLIFLGNILYIIISENMFWWKQWPNSCVFIFTINENNLHFKFIRCCTQFGLKYILHIIIVIEPLDVHSCMVPLALKGALLWLIEKDRAGHAKSPRCLR